MHAFMAAISVTADEIGLPTGTASIDAGLTNVINMMAGLIGGLAIIALIYGGVQLSLSEGDPGKVKSARSTILYASVGIILAMSAFLFIWFITHNLGNGPDFVGGG